MSYTPFSPLERRRHRGTISPMSPLSDMAGPLEGWSGGAGSSQLWPLADLALGYPFQVNEVATLYEAWYASGVGATNTLDIGVCELDGTVVVNTGSVTKVASAHVNVALTDTVLIPGKHYYAVMTVSGTVENFLGWIPAVGLNEAHGMVEATDAVPLTSPLTFSRTTRTFIPLFGFSLYSLSI